MTKHDVDLGFAFFDLDDTLLDGDSDYLWGEFLCEEQIVDAEQHRRENARYLSQYRDGSLDLTEFLEFQLRPLTQHPVDLLESLRARFVRRHIEHRLFEQGRELISSHRADGRLPVIVTATNRFITEPIAHLLNVDDLLATEIEFVGGKYTGRVSGTPCSGPGKVAHVTAWLEARGQLPADILRRSWFYSDSINDVPLLQAVRHAVAVNPDERLKAEAESRGWDRLELRPQAH